MERYEIGYINKEINFHKTFIERVNKKKTIDSCKFKLNLHGLRIVLTGKINDDCSEVAYEDLSEHVMKKIAKVANDCIFYRSFYNKLNAFTMARSARACQKNRIYQNKNNIPDKVFIILKKLKDEYKNTKDLFISKGNHFKCQEVSESLRNNEQIIYKGYTYNELLGGVLNYIADTLEGLVPADAYWELIERFESDDYLGMFRIVNCIPLALNKPRRKLMKEIFDLIRILEQKNMVRYMVALERIANKIFFDGGLFKRAHVNLKRMLMVKLYSMNYDYLPYWFFYFDYTK